ncbi:MAG: hypothetical protein ACRDJ9_07925 [Dehalococcoidia bacterium]
MWVEGMALLAGTLLGFLAGLTTFRRSLMWCRACGETLRCPRCVPMRRFRA